MLVSRVRVEKVGETKFGKILVMVSGGHGIQCGDEFLKL